MSQRYSNKNEWSSVCRTDNNVTTFRRLLLERNVSAFRIKHVLKSYEYHSKVLPDTFFPGKRTGFHQYLRYDLRTLPSANDFYFENIVNHIIFWSTWKALGILRRCKCLSYWLLKSYSYRKNWYQRTSFHLIKFYFSFSNLFPYIQILTNI